MRYVIALGLCRGEFTKESIRREALGAALGSGSDRSRRV
jgi:hypothetical protein